MRAIGSKKPEEFFLKRDPGVLMKGTSKGLAAGPIEPRIFTVRGQKVILDSDLALIYGVPTYRFNEAVKRNKDRFPEDFRFQLTKREADSLTSQFAISKPGRGGRRTLPYAFTEHGAVMAANVLNSARAVQMSVFVVRAFVKMRSLLAQDPVKVPALPYGRATEQVKAQVSSPRVSKGWPQHH